ncbi:hypothetical protein BTVI_152193 [Pitangus sulphuratus]|nr:hypothetical protein BTVI_152193 [Pitangus sulphuratus]
MSRGAGFRGADGGGSVEAKNKNWQKLHSVCENMKSVLMTKHRNLENHRIGLKVVCGNLENVLDPWITDAEWKAEKLLKFHKTKKYSKLSQAPTSSVLKTDF